MKRSGQFSTFKQRGEWVELLFMAAAASHGYHILKPWGDSLAYDVGIEHDGGLLRVQVKSTAVLGGTGYFCRCRRSYNDIQDYTLDEVDLFAAYVVPMKIWYLIPASEILGAEPKVGVMLHPVVPLKKSRECYEHYREAWGLLAKTRRELARTSKRR